MDENFSRGYVQLSKARRLNEELKFTENDVRNVGGDSSISRTPPPIDRLNMIYLSLVLAGIGFLLPYNSFVIAVDFFQARYPGTTVIFDISIVYIAVALVAVLINNILVETLSLGTRITFGYLVSFLTLNFIVMCEILWEVFGKATSYTINLVAVAIVSLGCTVQQSSFYGYTSMLPTRYTQAVMAGESAAGFWVSINRILTKVLVEDERGNTSMFFFFSIFTIIICFVMQQMIYKSEFVQYYINMCQERNRITLEPHEDAGLMDPFDQGNNNDPSRGQYGVLKLQTSPLGPPDSASGSVDMTNATGQFFEYSFSNPVYDPSGPNTTTNLNTGNSGPTYKVEDIVFIRGSYGSSGSSKRWLGVRRGLTARFNVAKLIYPYMASIGIAYFVTLCLYPGIISEIISCKFGSWMPVILMTAFNGADLLGKMLATLPFQWTRSQLLNFSCARALLIPLFLMCAIPRHTPILSNELWPIMLSVLLGITNGIVGSVPMIQAPTKVSEEHRELAGNIMTLSYTAGLTFGALLAYFFAFFLGSPVTYKEICIDPAVVETQPIFGTSNNVTTTSFVPESTTTLLAGTTAAVATTTSAMILNTLSSVEKVTRKMTTKRTTKVPKVKTTTSTLITGLLSTFLMTTTTTSLDFMNVTAGIIGNGASTSQLSFINSTTIGYDKGAF